MVPRPQSMNISRRTYEQQMSRRDKNLYKDQGAAFPEMLIAENALVAFKNIMIMLMSELNL